LWRGCSDADKSTDFHVASAHGHRSCSDGDCSVSHDGSWAAYCDGEGDGSGDGD